MKLKELEEIDRARNQSGQEKLVVALVVRRKNLLSSGRRQQRGDLGAKRRGGGLERTKSVTKVVEDLLEGSGEDANVGQQGLEDLGGVLEGVEGINGERGKGGANGLDNQSQGFEDGVDNDAAESAGNTGDNGQVEAVDVLDKSGDLLVQRGEGILEVLQLGALGGVGENTEGTGDGRQEGLGNVDKVVGNVKLSDLHSLETSVGRSGGSDNHGGGSGEESDVLDGNHCKRLESGVLERRREKWREEKLLLFSDG